MNNLIDEKYFLNNFFTHFYIPYRYHSLFSNNMKGCLRLEKLSMNLKFYNNSTQFIYSFIKQYIRQISCTLFNVLNKQTNCVYVFKHLYRYLIKNTLRFIYFASSGINCLRFNNICKLAMHIKSIIAINNLLKKNICYDEYVHIILDCIRTIFLPDFHIYSKYDDYTEKKGYCSCYYYDPDSIRSHYMPLIYKKLLTFFSKNKKIVKLSLNVQHLGSLLIRLEIKKNKFLKLDLVSNNSITQKVLKSDISALKNIIFRNGMKFNEIVVRNPNLREIILLNTDSNRCGDRNIMNIMSKKKIKRLY